MGMRAMRVIIAAFAAWFLNNAYAATLIVNTTADPSTSDGLCSLREAIASIDAGANSGDCVASGTYGTSDTVNFNIPGSGVQTIALASALPQITKPMVLDAFTQPGASPNTNGPSLGSNAVLLIEIDATNMGNAGDTGALTVAQGGGGTTIRGFVINRQVVAGIALNSSGGGNTVEGNYIGVNPAGTAAVTLAPSGQFGIVIFAVNTFVEDNDTIGGMTPAARNVIAGNAGFGEISVSAVTAGSHANGATIEGNFIGTNAAGTASLSQSAATCQSSAQAGISVGGNVADVTIGGGAPVTIGGATYFTGGNLISGNCLEAIHVAADATTTVIQGNLIGTDVTGTLSLGNLGTAIELFGVPGATSIIDNVISAAINTASNGEGIDVSSSNPTSITRNKIGTDITGTVNLGNQGHGIGVEGATNVLIDQNVIAFNGCCELGGQPGVFVASGSGVAISSNSIFSNQTIGIDLAPFGQSPNGTVTVNAGQTFPVITTATSGGGSTNIVGTLDSAANTNYQIEFFSNSACDASGFGEGQTLIGLTSVLTDGSGHASFNVTFGVNASVITSTATSVIAGILTNTSEFSACLTASAVATPPTIAKAFGNATIVVGGSTSLTFTLVNPNASSLTGVGFTDTLPAGLAVSTPNGLIGSCGGGTITATAGTNSITLTGAMLAASASCNFSVNVTGTTAGTKNNITGAVTSNEGGTGGTASASVAVSALTTLPPTISKAFESHTINVNNVDGLNFSLHNPNGATSLTGVGFVDPLPAGVVVANPNGISGSCGGGTITATPGSGTISLSGATLVANEFCNFSVTVLATATGTKNNMTGAVTSNEGGTGGTASDTLTVNATPPPPPPPPSKMTPVPTLQQWALSLLALALVGVAALTLRRRRRH